MFLFSAYLKCELISRDEFHIYGYCDKKDNLNDYTLVYRKDEEWQKMKNLKGLARRDNFFSRNFEIKDEYEDIQSFGLSNKAKQVVKTCRLGMFLNFLSVFVN